MCGPGHRYRAGTVSGRGLAAKEGICYLTRVRLCRLPQCSSWPWLPSSWRERV